MVEIKSEENNTVQLPNNIRQVGTPGEKIKIYIEDYVMTYLNQMTGEKPALQKAALLLGEKVKKESTDIYFISAAVAVVPMEWKEDRFKLSSDEWTALYDKINHYFKNRHILGWFLSRPGQAAAENAKKSGGSFTKTNNMAEAFKDADIVYPKSWAPFAAMEKRTELYGNGDTEGIKALEKELLAQNAEHKDWACTEELMATTKNGKALYLHCLPADITGVSCEEGEVDASVFDRYRDPLYKEASYKPYIIAAMIFLAKFENPQEILKKLEERSMPRIFK